MLIKTQIPTKKIRNLENLKRANRNKWTQTSSYITRKKRKIKCNIVSNKKSRKSSWIKKNSGEVSWLDRTWLEGSFEITEIGPKLWLALKKQI